MKVPRKNGAPVVAVMSHVLRYFGGSRYLRSLINTCCRHLRQNPPGKRWAPPQWWALSTVSLGAREALPSPLGGFALLGSQPRSGKVGRGTHRNGRRIPTIWRSSGVQMELEKISQAGYYPRFPVGQQFNQSFSNASLTGAGALEKRELEA